MDTVQEAPEPKSSDGYLLQVGAFRERERADSLLKQFSAKGFDAFVEKISLTEGQTAYRVRVGPYAELLEAEEVAKEILDQSGLQALVIPAPPPGEAPDNPS
ncbi:MAG: SPOR domain-containing protein, partial [Candidatus Binatia bacterium]